MAILESNMADTEVQTNDLAGFLDPENVGIGTGITFLYALVSSYRQKYVQYGGHIEIQDGGHQ